MATMRAKMYVQSVDRVGDSEELRLSAVTGKDPFGPKGESEDNTYARYTPNGACQLTINNPNLVGKFKQGQKFYLDFTEAPE